MSYRDEILARLGKQAPRSGSDFHKQLLAQLQGQKHIEAHDENLGPVVTVPPVEISGTPGTVDAGETTISGVPDSPGVSMARRVLSFLPGARHLSPDEEDYVSKHPISTGIHALTAPAAPARPNREENVVGAVPFEAPDSDEPGGHGLPGVAKRLAAHALAPGKVTAAEKAAGWLTGNPPESEGQGQKSESDKKETSFSEEHAKPKHAVFAGDDEGSTSPKPAPAQWVKAHNEPKVDPQMQEDLRDSLASEAAARLKAGNLAMEGQNVMAAGQEHAAQQELADLNQVQENMGARQAYLDKIGEDIERDHKALSDQKVDPERFWKNKGTGGKILGVIAMALGGFVQGIKGGSNPAADMIEGYIKDDLSAQRSDLENKWNSLSGRHSLLAERAQRYGSLDVAERQQAAARLQNAMLMAQAAAARATSPIEKANAQALAAQLQQKAVMVGIEMNKWVNAGYVGGAGSGGPGMYTDIKSGELIPVGRGPDGQMRFVASGDESRAREFMKQNDAATQATNAADDMINLLKNGGSKVYMPWTSEHGELQNLRTMLSMDTVREASGGSAGLGGHGSGAIKVLGEAQGDMFNPLKRQEVIARLEKLKQHIDASKDQRMSDLEGNPVVTSGWEVKGQNKLRKYIDTGETYRHKKNVNVSDTYSPPSGNAQR